MPELPEVETTVRGIKDTLTNNAVKKVHVLALKLRWPLDQKLNTKLKSQTVLDVTRRAKYILVKLEKGTLLIHLGMSGTLRIGDNLISKKHDHFILDLEDGNKMIYNDPRRFGSITYTTESPFNHNLLKNLGPEPFDKELNAKYLLEKSKNKKTSIKVFLMDPKIVVGVGNIYACEALFAAKISPNRKANTISLEEFKTLIKEVKRILKLAILKGGTTLKDFADSKGKPGYFAQKLKVYGRAGEECYVCVNKIESLVIGQRNTFYCNECQG